MQQQETDDWEPMDVDLSMNSSGRVSDVLASTAPSTCIAKKFNVDLSRFRRDESRPYLWMISLLIVVALAGFHFFLTSTCCSRTTLFGARTTLMSYLHGQDRAVEHIVQSLTDESEAIISVFYGPTGVGKTYASQIILEHAQNYSNIFHFTVISKKSFSLNAVMTQQTLCNFALVVVDDMALSDDHVVHSVKDVVARSILLKKGIHIILIYNSAVVSLDFEKRNDENFRKKLEAIFADVTAKKYFVKFKSFSNSDLRRCVEDSLSIYRFQVTQQLISEIIKNFDVSFDGCKGVDSKIKGMKL